MWWFVEDKHWWHVKIAFAKQVMQNWSNCLLTRMVTPHNKGNHYSMHNVVYTAFHGFCFGLCKTSVILLGKMSVSSTFKQSVKFGHNESHLCYELSPSPGLWLWNGFKCILLVFARSSNENGVSLDRLRNRDLLVKRGSILTGVININPVAHHLYPFMPSKFAPAE